MQSPHYDTSQRIGDWILALCVAAFFAAIVSHG
jgi:hypothetical protein